MLQAATPVTSAANAKKGAWIMLAYCGSGDNCTHYVEQVAGGHP
jgi:hypothetical protein